MVRPILTIVIGAVLALLMALAALFIVVPLVGRGGLWAAQAIAALVFLGMLAFVVRSVARAYRAPQQD